MTTTKRMTEAESIVWRRAKKHGYASIVNGERMVLTRDEETGATILAPLDEVARKVGNAELRDTP